MMKAESKLGPSVSKENSSRITKVGKFLRKFKIDELPQLFNVLKGDMSLVGPRPELPSFVNNYKKQYNKILKIKPGITDYATLFYSDEQGVLAQSDDPGKTYIEKIMPHKLRLYRRYIEDQNFILDVKIVFATLIKMAGMDVMNTE